MRYRAIGLVLAGTVAGVPLLRAQGPIAVGVEVAGYPAGVQVTGQVEVGVASRWALIASGGGNFTDRGDSGEHADESGEGPGGGLALRFHPRGASRGWFLGARLDVWRLTIDWRDPGPRTGTTRVTVYQPTGVLGYRFALGRALRLDASAALGAEINGSRSGEDVGDGAILLVGVAIRSAR